MDEPREDTKPFLPTFLPQAEIGLLRFEFFTSEDRRVAAKDVLCWDIDSGGWPVREQLGEEC